MATTPKFPKLSSSASKIEEIEWIEAARDAVAPGTYLASFFSLNTIGWLTAQIRGDMNCDLFEQREFDVNQEAVNVAVSAVKTELYPKLEETRATNARLTERAENAERKLAEANKRNDLQHQIIDSVCADRDEYAGKLETAQLENADLRNEVIKLKAKLYDLMTA